ncbi:DUF2513 domain-containing protein [Succinivibrio sp.]|uniref:DUF2513 domain-containing protein n=1 Tax=Succinivibrio sp. TaxID=2053619 RepID=UPI0038680EB6
MKRNWDLIRNILCALEEDRFVEYVRSGGLSDKETQKFTDLKSGRIDTESLEEAKKNRRNEIWLHVELLIDCGVIQNTQFDREGVNNNYRLSMQGHDFLEDLRNQEVWDKIKNQAFKSGAKLTWTFITAAAEQIVQRLASI